LHLHVAERGRSFRPSMSGSRTDPICRGDDSSRPPAPGCPPPPPAPGRPASRRPRQWSRDLSVGLLKPIGFPLVKQMSPLRADGCQPSGRHDLCSIRAATTARQAGHVERRRRGAEPASRPLLELGNTDRARRPQRGFSTSPLRPSGLRSKRPVFVGDCLPPPLQVMSSGSRPLSEEVETSLRHSPPTGHVVRQGSVCALDRHVMCVGRIVSIDPVRCTHPK
jgi:hypothetical protein